MEITETILKRNEQAIFALRQLYRGYGYLPYKMSRFEEYDLYVRNKDFLVSDQIITFADNKGKLLALKPDVTLSIIKNSADAPGVVQKLYYNENVYRSDKTGSSIREIMQAGLECVGDLGSYEIAEVVLLAAESLRLLGGSFVLDISHMGLIAAVMEEYGITDRIAVMTCLRQKNAHELAARFPEAGKLLALVNVSGAGESVLQQLAEMMTTEAEKKALTELSGIWQILSACGFGDSVRLDFSVGNDMKYYSGVVFKGYLEGIPTGILSGGQYDRLLAKMGRTSRAIGFALYLNLLERQGENSEQFTVDTVILHDEGQTPAQLIAQARQAAGCGSVLVCTELPAGRRYHKLIDLRKEGSRA